MQGKIIATSGVLAALLTAAITTIDVDDAFGGRPMPIVIHQIAIALDAVLTVTALSGWMMARVVRQELLADDKRMEQVIHEQVADIYRLGMISGAQRVGRSRGGLAPVEDV